MTEHRAISWPEGRLDPLFPLGRRYPLSAESCWRRLRLTPVGHIAFTHRALPRIHLVRHTVEDSDLLLTVGADSTAASATRRSVVAYEASNLDLVDRTAWSVTVVGLAEHANGGEQVSGTEAGPTPLVPGGTSIVVRLCVSEITGWRVEP